MAIARKLLVDPQVTPLYHCISRCVRRAFLCGPGYEHRKVWIEGRLEQLAAIFAIDICGYSVMDNHLHVVLRLTPDRAERWSDREVAELWVRLYPLRDRKGQVLPTSDEWLAARAQDAPWVQQRRRRLASLSWFMKCLKEPLAKQANREDQVTGAFWNFPPYCAPFPSLQKQWPFDWMTHHDLLAGLPMRDQSFFRWPIVPRTTCG
jgi:REP element-mobilizing transposase RayT